MRFLFRTDASTAIGSGHVARCASLAQALAAAGHEVHFASRALAGDHNRWLEAEGFRAHEISGVADAAMTESVDAVICSSDDVSVITLTELVWTPSAVAVSDDQPRHGPSGTLPVAAVLVIVLPPAATWKGPYTFHPAARGSP